MSERESPRPVTVSSAPPPLVGLMDELAPDLAEVERVLAVRVDSDLELVKQASRYLYRSGGKRLRPLLLLMSARAVGGGDQAPWYAAMIEIVHTATLMHDDIVDRADTRRGKESLNSMLGDDITVLLGDFLYIQSVALAAEKGDLRFVTALCEVSRRLTEGMLLEAARGGVIGLTREEHLDILRLKTASLFAACGRMGAMCAGASSGIEEALAAYGTHLGMAFQLADDLLDFTASEAQIGKPVLSDLREGHLTLPVLHALEQEPDEAPLVERVLETGDLDAEDARSVLRLVERTGGLAAAREAAETHAEAAREALAPVPASPYRDAFAALTAFVVQRRV